MPVSMEALYIAKDKKSGMHSLLRFVPDEVLNAPIGEVGIEQANAFLMARDPESLVESAARLGPMFVSKSDLTGRLLMVADAQSKAGKRLRQSDSPRLLAECFFDPYAASVGNDGLLFEGAGRVPRASADRTVEAYDFCGNSSDYGYLGDHFSVLIEPLQDWILLRNLLSITLRLGGMLRRCPSGEALLEDAGFSRVERKTLDAKLVIDAPGYAIPVMFNPYFREGSIPHNDVAFDANAIWPLYSRIAEERPGRYGLGIYGALRDCDGSIRFATAAQVEAAHGSFKPRKLRPEEERWTYLVIEESGGCGQKELADKLLSSLDRVLYRPRLSYSGEQMREVSVDSYDLPSALWSLVRSHPNHYLMTCDNCHRTVFSTTQGPNRRFCSDSCRVTWNKRH